MIQRDLRNGGNRAIVVSVPVYGHIVFAGPEHRRATPLAASTLETARFLQGICLPA
jgi:hypothetical protein